MTSAPARLLLVNAEPDGERRLTAQLGELGYSIATSCDEQATLGQLESGQVELIVLRIEPARMAAEHLLVQLKTNSRLRHIPVMLLAGAEQIETAERCIVLGADDYLTEPFSPALMRSRIAACLEVQRLRAAQQSEKELLKFERDIQIGRQIQADFLPERLPDPAGWEIAARFHAARNVSGDFYDAFQMSRGRIGLVIGDVCDKGVGAALFMSLFRSLIRVLAQQNYATNLLDSIDDLPAAPKAGGERRRPLPSTGTLALKNAVELTNNYIAKNHYRTSMFATLFFGVLDPATGQLIYVNAGHEHPAIVGPDGIKARLKGTGMAVGMLPDVPFGIEQAQLAPGDMLVCYTDGVPDARNPAGKLFGDAGLLALLSEPEPTAAGMLDRIETNVYVHIADADQFDDITMLAVRRQ
jgi:phosphoserine phosphatase RsbU/P